MEDVHVLRSMCLMAEQRLSTQLQNIKMMSETFKSCDTDGTFEFEFELEILRLEGLMADCRGIAAYADVYIRRNAHVMQNKST